MTKSRKSHMESRKKSSGMSYRDLAKEFGVGKSTAHRMLTADKAADGTLTSKPVVKQPVPVISGRMKDRAF